VEIAYPSVAQHVASLSVFGRGIADYSLMIKPRQRSLEEINIVLVGESTVAEVEEFLTACEHCADNVPIALDYLLDALTGCDPQVTEYVMCRPACCPFCLSEIREKTLVAV
jgi:hypothetical protein